MRSIKARVVDAADETSLRVEAINQRGSAMALDASGDSALSPRDAVLAALAGCTAADVISILRKKREQPDAYELEVHAEEAPDHPRVFTSIVVEHRLHGDIEPAAVHRAIELSATRYCPVSAMLAAACPVEHRYLLVGRRGDERREVVARLSPDRAL